jgi:hypothetical protein
MRLETVVNLNVECPLKHPTLDSSVGRSLGCLTKTRLCGADKATIQGSVN